MWLIYSVHTYSSPGIILCMCLANDWQHYIVTRSLIGRANTQNDPWKYCSFAQSHRYGVITVLKLMHTNDNNTSLQENNRVCSKNKLSDLDPSDLSEWVIKPGFPQKSQKKVPWFFYDFSRPKSKFPDKKIPIFVFAAHVSNCRQTDPDAHSHTWFDQGQLTIQLILLVIELIQEVKTTLFNLIKMGNRFSY